MSTLNLAASVVPESILFEILEATDRSVIIVGAAIIDEVLELKLKDSLNPSPDNKKDRLFDDGCALHNLSPKIDLAQRLGLIPEELAADLHGVRRIRNDYAHKINVPEKTLIKCDAFVSKYLHTNFNIEQCEIELGGSYYSADPGIANQIRKSSLTRIFLFRISLALLIAKLFEDYNVRGLRMPGLKQVKVTISYYKEHISIYIDNVSDGE